MKAITSLNFHAFTHSREVLALWPSPIDSDHCFAEQGFTEFGDTDDPWETDLRELIERCLRLVGEPVEILTDIQVCRENWWGKRIPVELSIVEKFVTVMRDDQFGGFSVRGLTRMTLTANHGHPMLVIQSVNPVRIDSVFTGWLPIKNFALAEDFVLNHCVAN